MKIAVIGSGVSGLVSAYHLSSRHDVHLFEANADLGGHTHTVTVDVPSGRYAVDTGFIVFNDRTYPRFIRLMNKLNVSSQPSSMSFSVKGEANGLEYNGTNLNTLFAQRTNLFRPAFHRMIRDILRFNKEAPSILTDPQFPLGTTLGDYLHENKYSQEFMKHYIIPMGSAIWSSGADQMKEFPIAYFVQFFKNHGMLSVDDRPIWRVVKGGSQSYIPALTEPFITRIHTRAPVERIQRLESGVRLTVRQNEREEEHNFDHVVCAGHADQMLPLLADATPQEKDILGQFRYQENKTVLHTDTSVLPKRKLAWAAWNYFTPKNPQSTVAVSYNMNILQTIRSPETFIVSLNMDDRIDPKKILKKILYHHPIYSSQAVESQKRWGEISGKNRTHFCGAYWGYGFHEDGVASGERVCESLGISVA
jgi:predicted NAD/FAD-binding protein